MKSAGRDGNNDLVGLRLEDGDALLLDFDGTIAEIGPDPDAISVPPETRSALARLSARLEGALAILSGRDLRDLAARTPPALWRAGGHGLEILAPNADPPPAPPPLPEAVLAPLRAVARIEGVRLELKGPVAALHFRAAPAMQVRCLAAARMAAAAPGLIHQQGKMVVEVKPAAAHKGHALRALCAAPPFAGRRPVMLGDDTTDEDAFLAAHDLGGLAVKVGPGPTAAGLHATDPAAVRAWLAREAG